MIDRLWREYKSSRLKKTHDKGLYSLGHQSSVRFVGTVKLSLTHLQIDLFSWREKKHIYLQVLTHKSNQNLKMMKATNIIHFDKQSMIWSQCNGFWVVNYWAVYLRPRLTLTYPSADLAVWNWISVNREFVNRTEFDYCGCFWIRLRWMPQCLLTYMAADWEANFPLNN